MSKKRVLLIAENITLAQTVRLARLGAGLPQEQYDVHFGASEFAPLVFADTSFTCHELYTLPKATVFRAMENGKRLYETASLMKYVKAELALIEAVRPDVIVGDFRLSLSTSAELAQVPWATLINAYFSPYAIRDRFPVPDHPIVSLLGEATTEKYFPIALPRVFQHFAAPINTVRKKHGLSAIGSLLEVLTYANATLYPDDPALVPLRDAPPHHRFLGPLVWSPRVPMPTVRGDDTWPLVYATLGSSGKLDVVPRVLEALETLPVRVLLATAGRAVYDALPANVTAVPFAPGSQVAAMSQLVISNGGSTTGYQALCEGTPVLGLPSNLDQFLTMQAIERAGAGISVKARSATPDAIRNATRSLLDDPSFTHSAKEIAMRCTRLDPHAAFEAWLQSLFTPKQQSQATA